MHSCTQHQVLNNSQALTFDSFPAWAEQFIRQLGLVLYEREQGADYQRWLIDFEGSRLLLCFEHYAGCAWLVPFSEQDRETALWLTQYWQQISA
ncbi:DUF3630 family protein [Oceanisphaera avium]|uniref:DUF3630 domain-containing protein n=1 Tax=Oceanisphaera avium TaxID=1903694 RepID=A0A1Y0CZK9_9GAMM|nr:DUF3630 family protein [Oceanisphaera avium]ART80434.1 hypothetical protein CBP12_09985 [Oceanisphaera avium]